MGTNAALAKHFTSEQLAQARLKLRQNSEEQKYGNSVIFGADGSVEKQVNFETKVLSNEPIHYRGGGNVSENKQLANGNLKSHDTGAKSHDFYVGSHSVDLKSNDTSSVMSHDHVSRPHYIGSKSLVAESKPHFYGKSSVLAESGYDIKQNADRNSKSFVITAGYHPREQTQKYGAQPNRKKITASNSATRQDRFETKLDPREELMIAIRNAGGRTNLRKVSGVISQNLHKICSPKI
jgi:hypothetical protein